jgi:hypothetical protein
MPVKWDELLEAYEYASARFHRNARLGLPDLRRVFLLGFRLRRPLEDEDDHNDEDELDEEEEGELSEAAGSGETGSDDPGKLPADILDADKYLPVPDKRELDLGSRLVFRFAREVLPKDYNEIASIFNKRGAYSKFKGLLTRRKALDQWYAFEEKATQEALRDWCADNGIEIEETKKG